MNIFFNFRAMLGSFASGLIAGCVLMAIIPPRAACADETPHLYRAVLYANTTHGLALTTVVDINGTNVICVIDTGSNLVAINQDVSDSLKIKPEFVGASSSVLANGSQESSTIVSFAFVSLLTRDGSNPTRLNVRGVVSPKGMPCLLGLSYLTTFKFFAFVQKNGARPSTLLLRD